MLGDVACSVDVLLWLACGVAAGRMAGVTTAGSLGLFAAGTCPLLLEEPDVDEEVEAAELLVPPLVSVGTMLDRTKTMPIMAAIVLSVLKAKRR